MIFDYLWFFLCQVPINVFAHSPIGLFLFFNFKSSLYLKENSALTVIRTVHIRVDCQLTKTQATGTKIDYFTNCLRVLPIA